MTVDYFAESVGFLSP